MTEVEKTMAEWKSTRGMDLPAGPLGAEGVQVDPGPLVGTWINFDAASRAIHSLVLTREEGTVRVHTFGACSPAPCDWGKVRGEVFSLGVGDRVGAGFKAFYDFGFMETQLVAYLNLRLLVVDSYNTFKDASPRSRYFTRDHFYQA